MDPLSATAVAHPNIALVKYWGKRDVRLNLPAAGSLSLTLGGLETRTQLAWRDDASADEILLDGEPVEGQNYVRLSKFLDRIRRAARFEKAAVVSTENSFPTAAGLASSASGFAALALAASSAAGLELSPTELSRLARLGSGSAARSVFGGWALMDAGGRDDGEDAVARPIAPPEHWDLRCLVAVVRRGPKSIGSTRAMEHTARTSPYYRAWIEDVERALPDAERAVLARDFDALARITEASCLRMHASALAADPGILYWQGATVEVMHAVRAARAAGTPAFFTIDAGPHVKVFCPAEAAEDVATVLGTVPQVLDVLRARPGHGARLVENEAK